MRKYKTDARKFDQREERAIGSNDQREAVVTWFSVVDYFCAILCLCIRARLPFV